MCDEAAQTAAEHGQIQILKWLRSKGEHFYEDLCSFARDLEVLKWLLKWITHILMDTTTGCLASEKT